MYLHKYNVCDIFLSYGRYAVQRLVCKTCMQIEKHGIEAISCMQMRNPEQQGTSLYALLVYR